MSLSRTLVFVLILGIMISPLSAGDVEDLKAAFDQALEYLSQKDLDAFLSIWHPEAVLFTRNEVHPTDRAKLDDRVWADLLRTSSPESSVPAIPSKRWNGVLLGIRAWFGV